MRCVRGERAGYWQGETGEWADQINLPRKVSSCSKRSTTVISVSSAAVTSHATCSLKGLIDELRFWVHPAVWGPGEHPFEGEEQVRLELIDAKTFDSGVALLR